MTARHAVASLKLLAFIIFLAAGLIACSPVTVTLSHYAFDLFLFCLIGLGLGRIAQAVVAEFGHNPEIEIRSRYRGVHESTAVSGPEESSGHLARGAMALWGIPLSDRAPQDGRLPAGPPVERNARTRKEQMV